MQRLSAGVRIICESFLAHVVFSPVYNLCALKTILPVGTIPLPLDAATVKIDEQDCGKHKLACIPDIQDAIGAQSEQGQHKEL